MTLPKLPVPTYSVTCPSGLKVKFRPFLVKEEKLLLMAVQTGERDALVDATGEILNNCIRDYTPKVQVDKLPLFDVEYLLLQLRARSIGEIVKLKYRCNQPYVSANGNTEICGATSEYTINLLEVEPKFKDGHTKVIPLTGDIGITMAYPKLKTFSTKTRKELTPEETIDFLIASIESVHTKDKVFMLKDIERTEAAAFVESLSHHQLAAIDKFFDTLPVVDVSVNFECPKCKYTEKIVLKGFDSFFV